MPTIGVLPEGTAAIDKLWRSATVGAIVVEVKASRLRDLLLPACFVRCKLFRLEARALS